MSELIASAVIMTIVTFTCWLAFFHYVHLRGMRVIDVLGVLISTSGSVLVWIPAVQSMVGSTVEVNLCIWGLMLVIFPAAWFRRWYYGFFLDILKSRNPKTPKALFCLGRFSVDIFDICFGAIYASFIWFFVLKRLLTL